MQQLKEKHATNYASLHNSLLYRKRRDVTVENYEGPLIVWAGVIGTEGLPWVILAVSRHHEPGVPRACAGHRLMSKAHTVTKPWYNFFDCYYVGLLQSRSATKHTCPLPYLLLLGYQPLQTRWMRVNPGSQVENLVFIKESLTRIVQSANMHIRHLLASLTAVERSTSFLHCIFLKRPARQRVNIKLRCGRGIHGRSDSATCRHSRTRMQHPSYLVWTFNNTRHLS
jgi:hypothetical protein